MDLAARVGLLATRVSQEVKTKITGTGVSIVGYATTSTAIPGDAPVGSIWITDDAPSGGTGDIDGGNFSSIYGGTTTIDGGPF